MRKMYSEKQVEELAQKKVQEMIASGQIALGTKLYHHFLASSGETYEFGISFISSYPYALDDVWPESNELDKCSWLIFTSEGNVGFTICGGRITNDTSSIEITGVSDESNLAISAYQISNGDILSDQVTPL